MANGSAHITGTLARARRYALAAGALGLAGAVVCLVIEAEAFFQGYLFAFVFWLGLSLGCLSLLMLHHLTAGGWGFVTQRLLETGALTVGLMAVLVVPVLLGLHALYPWMDDAVVVESVRLQHKQAYLNAPFYLVRVVFYFACWTGAAVLLRRWSRRMDATGNARYAARLRALGAGGLIGHVLLLTFATVDFVMALEPEWHSTIYPWMMLVSEALAALAFTVLVLGRLAKHEPLAEVVRTKHFHDYGNLMLAFIILWTYMLFAQYLIIWSGNLPHDIEWYVHRSAGGWGWVGPALGVFHFAVPFVLLLSRRTKRNARTLSGLALGLLVVHAVFVAWLVLPAFREAEALTFLAGLASFAGIGGLWLAAYAWLLPAQSLLPTGDPRYAEALESAS